MLSQSHCTPSQCSTEKKFVTVTIPAETTMTPSLLNLARPGKNQGSIKLLEPVNIEIPYGTQFTTQSGPMHCTWTIGSIGQEVSNMPYEVVIPAGKRVIRTNDKSGLISLTQVEQKFLLESEVSVKLPSNTVAHCELVQVVFASTQITLQ
ncbi:hypothetical protein Indivirus_2_116 [Indivirus ILV1]|uniref:Uncharacterized protein n=1 Tax=Indivirus ILV1 TaxID=1977633 RepID=A0A1V0SDE8_9VIRU|nr:hypothetical protein Indivirus_2_116 [Indivirus ILV1]